MNRQTDDRETAGNCDHGKPVRVDCGVSCPLYQMQMHEVLHTNSQEAYEIMRVAGGWIYTRFCENGTGGYDMSTCFVPFNNEFIGS